MVRSAKYEGTRYAANLTVLEETSQIERELPQSGWRLDVVELAGKIDYNQYFSLERTTKGYPFR